MVTAEWLLFDSQTVAWRVPGSVTGSELAGLVTDMAMAGFRGPQRRTP